MKINVYTDGLKYLQERPSKHQTRSETKTLVKGRSKSIYSL